MTISLLLDCETTGLPLPTVADITEQPRIIELAIMRIEDGKIISEREWLLDPERQISAKITKITGITNDDLVGMPKFREVLGEIEEAFSGADQLIAHNAPFDTFLLRTELKLCHANREIFFPWPPVTLCTVQEYHHEKGRRLKMTELYKMKIGKALDQAHRALDDVRALAEVCIKEGLV